MGLQIVDAPERQRYEARSDGEVIGFAAYQKTAQLIVFTHTEVDPGWEGKGVGGALVRGALDDARQSRLAVLPICPFVQRWMGSHPAYHDLDYRAPGSRVHD